MDCGPTDSGHLSLQFIIKFITGITIFCQFDKVLLINCQLLGVCFLLNWIKLCKFPRLKGKLLMEVSLRYESVIKWATIFVTSLLHHISFGNFQSRK